MFSPQQSSFGPATTVTFLLTRGPAVLVAMLVIGCANPGPPQPPSLHLPVPVLHLAAQRVGSSVLLSWVTPANSTEGDSQRGQITAVICRQEIVLPEAANHPVACDPVQRIPVVAGPAEIRISLPDRLLDGKPSLLGFQVELLNEHNRSAGPSAPVYSLSGKAPSPVGALSVSTLRNAAQITWTPAQMDAPVQLDRRLLSAAPATPLPHDGRSAAKARQTVAKERGTPVQATLTLPASPVDPGGMVDRGIQDGDTLTYIAQRVRTVTFPFAPSLRPGPAQGKVSRHREPTPTTLSVELRGEPSPPVTFTFHDTLPPAVPTGLAAIPGRGLGAPAANLAPNPIEPAGPIDLSWEPSAEHDLLGYNLYRAEEGGSFARLNPEIIPGTSFRDLTAMPGKVYSYRLTAVDQRQNESAPCAPLLVHP